MTICICKSFLIDWHFCVWSTSSLLALCPQGADAEWYFSINNSSQFRDFALSEMDIPLNNPSTSNFFITCHEATRDCFSSVFLLSLEANTQQISQPCWFLGTILRWYFFFLSTLSMSLQFENRTFSSALGLEGISETKQQNNISSRDSELCSLLPASGGSFVCMWCPCPHLLSPGFVSLLIRIWTMFCGNVIRGCWGRPSVVQRCDRCLVNVNQSAHLTQCWINTLSHLFLTHSWSWNRNMSFIFYKWILNMCIRVS